MPSEAKVKLTEAKVIGVEVETPSLVGIPGLEDRGSAVAFVIGNKVAFYRLEPMKDMPGWVKEKVLEAFGPKKESVKA